MALEVLPFKSAHIKIEGYTYTTDTHIHMHVLGSSKESLRKSKGSVTALMMTVQIVPLKDWEVRYAMKAGWELAASFDAK